MDAFGYSEKKIGRNGLHRLSEVTFQGSPTEVRRIAEFLLKAAAEMENSEKFGHLHAQDTLEPWDHSWPDVIVIAEEQK
jgi:hypothetical protein